MQPTEYFEQVVRFLETQGWNTSTSKPTPTVHLVTGTRQSENYYNRMLAVVAVEDGTALTVEHLQFLIAAGEEHDVDQLLATGRDGMTDRASQLATEHGIQYIDPEEIDDAFIDEFRVDEQSVVDLPDTTHTSRVDARQMVAVVGLYVLVGLAIASGYLVVELTGTPSAQLSVSVGFGSLLVGGPLLGAVAGLVLVESPATAAFGAVVGYLGFLALLVGTGGVLQLLGLTNLVFPSQLILAYVAVAVPTGLVAAGSTVLADVAGHSA